MAPQDDKKTLPEKKRARIEATFKTAKNTPPGFSQQFNFFYKNLQEITLVQLDYPKLDESLIGSNLLNAKQLSEILLEKHPDNILVSQLNKKIQAISDNQPDNATHIIQPDVLYIYVFFRAMDTVLKKLFTLKDDDLLNRSLTNFHFWYEQIKGTVFLKENKDIVSNKIIEELSKTLTTFFNKIDFDVNEFIDSLKNLCIIRSLYEINQASQEVQSLGYESDFEILLNHFGRMNGIKIQKQIDHYQKTIEARSKKQKRPS